MRFFSRISSPKKFYHHNTKSIKNCQVKPTAGQREPCNAGYNLAFQSTVGAHGAQHTPTSFAGPNKASTLRLLQLIKNRQSSSKNGAKIGLQRKKFRQGKVLEGFKKIFLKSNLSSKKFLLENFNFKQHLIYQDFLYLFRIQFCLSFP